MNARTIAYWVTTVLITLAMISGGGAYLAHASFTVKGLGDLGYPPYVINVLGFWKLLGGVTIVAPKLPRLKEWAYAGIAFDLSGAAYSHAAHGDPTSKVITVLLLLGLTIVSWALRPADRRLDGPRF